MRTPTVLAVAAVLGLVACGNDRAVSGVPTSPAEHDSTSSSIEATVPTTPSTTVLPVTTPSVAGSSGSDPADAYLGATTEIYQRPLPDGRDFVVRLSNGSYAAVFGLTWTAPTGSADLCLGDHALFLGVPGDIGAWGSAWVAAPWFDDPKPTQPAVLQSSMSAAEQAIPPTEFLVVRTAPDAATVVLAASDGTEIDRAPVSNSIAMLVVAPQAKREGETVNDLSVGVVSADGQQSAPLPLAWPESAAPSECGPGDAPQRPLPPSGVQPANPDAAATAIRQRYELLVNRSIPADQKPSDLLDDNTGVQAAIAEMDSGPYRDTAASATYSINELVFTKPYEAWFRYTITTSASTFADRFGTAIFNGKVWQITRATICQDLALAQAKCRPEPPIVEPPPNPQWDAAWQEWTSRAMQYTGNDGCPPLSQC